MSQSGERLQGARKGNLQPRNFRSICKAPTHAMTGRLSTNASTLGLRLRSFILIYYYYHSPTCQLYYNRSIGTIIRDRKAATAVAIHVRRNTNIPHFIVSSTGSRSPNTSARELCAKKMNRRDPAKGLEMTVSRASKKARLKVMVDNEEGSN